jgi:hypothetical protein
LALAREVVGKMAKCSGGIVTKKQIENHDFSSLIEKKKRKGLFLRTKPVNKALKFFELRLMNGEFFLLLCNGFQQNVNVSLLCA